MIVRLTLIKNKLMEVVIQVSSNKIHVLYSVKVQVLTIHWKQLEIHGRCCSDS